MSDKALNGGKKQAIRRHVECLKETFKEVDKWYRTVEAEKITPEVAHEEVNRWIDNEKTRWKSE